MILPKGDDTPELGDPVFLSLPGLTDRCRISCGVYCGHFELYLGLCPRASVMSQQTSFSTSQGYIYCLGSHRTRNTARPEGFATYRPGPQLDSFWAWGEYERGGVVEVS